jgi:hypothetical protein
MLDPVISSRVLVKGLIDGRWNGKGFGISAYLPEDPVQARRTVNALDEAQEIAGYYRQFMTALTLAGWKRLPSTPVADSPAPDTDGNGFWATLIMAIMGIIRGRS